MRAWHPSRAGQRGLHRTRFAIASLVAGVAAMAFVMAMPARADAAAPTILLLHGGGWQSGGTAEMNPWREDFEAYGYRTRSVAYPPGNVTRSIDFADGVAQQERRAGRTVIAYGVSAGGTIAAALAAAGRVDGAVNVLGPTDFVRWVSPVGMYIMLAARMTEAEKRSASPLRRLNGRQTPQLLQCGLADPLTTVDQCSRYVDRAARGNPDTTMQMTPNAHGQWAADRDHARRWVQARWPAVPALAARVRGKGGRGR